MPLDFTLEDITTFLCDKTPEFLNVRDDQLSLALLDGMERCMLDDMVSWFLRREGIDSDEKQVWGPPKWNYTEGDPCDSFDYYAVTGCPNCGSSYELDQPYVYHVDPPTLLCLECGYRACQLHFRDESESLVERLSSKGQLPSPSSVSSASEPPTAQSATQLAQPGSNAAIYVRGAREQYDFGQKGKEWWQGRYLPRSVRLNDLNRAVTMISMMSKLKAPTIKELCEVCGNTEAYYTTYQARSADEGMTIMYECTRCHHRKTFNN